MFDHPHQNSNGVHLAGPPNQNDQQVNGVVIRRQIRNVQQPTHLKIPNQAQQMPWIPPYVQPISPANGFPNHALDLDAETFRPISTTVDSMALQSYSTAMAQKAGILPANNPNRLSAQPSLTQLLPTQLESTLPADDKEEGSKGQENYPSDEAGEMRRIYAGLASTVAIGIGASIMALLAFQLLLGLNYYESPALSGVQLPQGSMPQILRDLSTALSTVALTFSLCSIMSSFLHFYLCMRFIGQNGNIAECVKRIDTYRRRTLYLRTLSNGGFFIGIIVFLGAMVSYQQLLNTAFGTVLSSTVSSVILGIGVLLCTITLLVGFCSAGFCLELSRNKAKDVDKRGTLV